MRPIGGEIEIVESNCNIFFTDSGRSSFRLFLRSIGNLEKKVLIPNFLCDVIIHTLNQEKVTFDFYSVDENLNIIKSSIIGKEYDVLYVIHYFGKITTIDFDIKDKILVEDYVFNFDFKNRLNHSKWFAFNSFRKIVNVTDGSRVKTNIDIDKRYINEESASFVQFKEYAKNIKFDYIHKNKGKENIYLENFKKGETILDNQIKIHSASCLSVSRLCDYNNEGQEIRSTRYRMLSENIAQGINLNPVYFSFFVLKITDRDRVRAELMNKNIFVPIHWKSVYAENLLSNQVLSIPLFENIKDNEFLYLLETLKKIIK